jgi:DNA-binding GntR family transcriptional regulator
MQPGSVIHESELMQELGLGRTPIREALMQLEAEKLVIVVPRRGMFVTEISITDLQQLYEVRTALEALCASLAAERVTADHLELMKEWAARYEAADLDDKKDLMGLDRDFHYLLAEAAGNRFLRNEFEIFYNLSLRIWHLSLDRIRPEDLDVRVHLDILAAIEAHDACRAGALMRGHIQTFHTTLKQYL